MGEVSSADQRVPVVPFAQIANSVLRDRRLSFRARGLLAMVLSYPGDWSASREWLEGQSERDGREAIQSALNELNALGYRTVVRENVDNLWKTVVVWSAEPPADGFPGGRGSRPSGKPSVFLKTVTNTKTFEGRESRPSDERFSGWPERDGSNVALAPEVQAQRAREVRQLVKGSRNDRRNNSGGLDDRSGATTTG